MVNQTIFIAYLSTWLIYFVLINWHTVHKKLRRLYTVGSLLIPSFVALSLTYIYLFGQGAMVKQFVAESEKGVDPWFLWLDIWSLLLIVSVGAVVAHVFCIFMSLSKQYRLTWLPVTISGALMSLFAFFTVWENFPDI